MISTNNKNTAVESPTRRMNKHNHRLGWRGLILSTKLPLLFFLVCDWVPKKYTENPLPPKMEFDSILYTFNCICFLNLWSLKPTSKKGCFWNNQPLKGYSWQGYTKHTKQWVEWGRQTSMVEGFNFLEVWATSHRKVPGRTASSCTAYL